MTLALRPSFSQAIKVLPEPPNKSKIISSPFELLFMALQTKATGFGVVCPTTVSLSNFHTEVCFLSECQE